MVFDLGTRLLSHCASFFAYGSSILDLLIRPLGGQVENTESGNGNGNENGNSEKIVISKSVYGQTRYSYQVLSTEYIEVRCKFVGDE